MAQIVDHISIAAGQPVPQANAAAVDLNLLRRELESQISGEVRFDRISRALYSTDASVYQIRPLGVVIVKSREDVIRTVEICTRLGCPLTVRGGGTSQAGQAIGPGLQIDTSKYFNRVLELNAAERWARVEPGIVLDELNSYLRPHGLRFAPDISTANRATLGGMMANNSSGARSVLYGKTIDHVLEQHVVLADGSLVHLRPLTEAELENICLDDTLEAAGYRVVRRLATQHAEEIDRRFPKIMRRVSGYNLDAFVRSDFRFNLVNLMVGSEGTLGVIVEAKIKLVPLPKTKAVLGIQFPDLLKALSATPVVLKHGPSAVEVMDKFILDNAKKNAALWALREEFIQGDPGALLCVEFYADRQEDLVPRLDGLVQDLSERRLGDRFFRVLDPALQARIWSLREAALGLSMAMKGDAKTLAFVEDTAVGVEKLRDYIERFLQVVERHGSTAGVYAHASVGCLHVRPIINLKTEEGLRKFEAIASDIADLVLEFGGALSAEHGDGLVRSPFMERMFGPVLYEAFRTIKRTFDPQGILNPGKIVDAPPLTAQLRYGPHYKTAETSSFFDYSEYGGIAGAVEMCSGIGACRKTLAGTMCPSYMVTREEAHTTRGRANVLREAMSGDLDVAQDDPGIFDALDLCLECRACKSECPVSVDMSRLKSEFLAGFWSRNGTPLRARVFGNIDRLSKWGSRFAPASNVLLGSQPAKWINEKVLEVDRRRAIPEWQRMTFIKRVTQRRQEGSETSPDVVLFNDTFTNYYNPEIGLAALEVLEAAGLTPAVYANPCCGRPLISQGLLDRARKLAERNASFFYEIAAADIPIVFCEPSCLSAVREDLPELLRGEAQRKAYIVGRSCFLFEEFLEREWKTGRIRLNLKPHPGKILLHAHCHQKAMGLVAPAKALLRRIPDSQVDDLDSGCCGMAGSFGYSSAHFEISRRIGERSLLPAARNRERGAALIANGTSCRQQVQDFAGGGAIHPALFLRSLLTQ